MGSFTWTGPDKIVRTGEIWCPGPTRKSWWVIPDERRAGEAFCVEVGLDSIQGKQQAARSTEAHHRKVLYALWYRQDIPGVLVSVPYADGTTYNANVPQHCQPRSGDEHQPRLPLDAYRVD